MTSPNRVWIVMQPSALVSPASVNNADRLPVTMVTHVHLTMDAATLGQQTLASSASTALKGLSLAREYVSYDFTTLCDLGSADLEWPTVDLRNAINAGFVEGPWLIVAAHILSASAGQGDLRGFYHPRWTIPVSAIADDAGSIKRVVRREHTLPVGSLARQR